jgi:hypothetical protein
VEKPGGDSHAIFWLKFVLHQLLGVWSAILIAPDVTALGFTTLRHFGKVYPSTYFYWILAGRPYFPIQVLLALFLGWVFGRNLWHRSMVWVWVLPLAILCYAFVTLPTLNPDLIPPAFQAGRGESRFSHYFGWGCGPWNHCIDQVTITLPFYTALAYSLGAWLGAKIFRRVNRSKLESGVVLIFGIWFFAAAVRDFYLSVRPGWHWRVLPYESVPAGIGAYLILLAIMRWRLSSTQTNASAISRPSLERP